jgi:hypothetical protein
MVLSRKDPAFLVRMESRKLVYRDNLYLFNELNNVIESFNLIPDM